MYFYKCPYCGSNNDPGEICDCIKYKNKTQSKLNHKVKNKEIQTKENQIFKRMAK